MSSPLNVGGQRADQAHPWPFGWRHGLAAIVTQSSPDGETPASGALAAKVS
jgi:hypothetical protein